ARAADAHQGALLALAADTADGFVSGGDDGRVARIARDGAAAELARFQGQWAGHVAALPDGRVAAAVGRAVQLIGSGEPRALGPHQSTVSGLARGGARLAVAHYGGVSLWDPDAAAASEPELLPWKGSHLCVAPSPDQKFVATAT